jgi:uncharacterized membrane protein
MARTATQKRSSAARRARPATNKRGAGPARGGLKGDGDGLFAPSHFARTAAKKALKVVARKTVQSGAGAIRLAADRAAGAGKSALKTGLSRRLPIQCSIDVAVPLRVAWDEWMNLGWLPEGVHRIEDVEREDDYLVGRISGPRSRNWEAEIVDERDQESFAWRSVEGSDCAGLVTFHQLSERLTRIELDLDVLPTNPAEALTLGSHLAHRRAETDLRRFKAHVEFINPDAYESATSQNGSEPEHRQESEDEDEDDA